MPTDNSGNPGQGNRGSQNPEKKPGYEAANWKDPKNPGATQSGGQAERNRNLGSDPASNRDRDPRNEAAGRDARNELAGRDPRNEIGADRNRDPRNEASEGIRGANQNQDAANSAQRSNFDTEENDLEDENPNRFPNRDL